MGRSSGAIQSAQTFAPESTNSYNQAQGDISQYRANEDKLKAGLNVGADPFKTTGYLSNVNKLQSEALNTNAESNKAEMARWNKATGGLNSSQTALAQRDVGLRTGRMADTLTAERGAADYRSNLDYQKYLAAAPLAGAGAESGLYDTASRGWENALNNYTELSGQKYGYYGGIIKAYIDAAGKAASGGAAG